MNMRADAIENVALGVYLRGRVVCVYRPVGQDSAYIHKTMALSHLLLH